MRRVFALLVGFVAAAFVGEGLVRVAWDEAGWLYLMTPRQVSDIDVHRLSEDGELLYELTPGASATLDGAYGDRRVTVNSLGFRGPEPREEPFRILAVGGSNTYGASVSDDETWPARLDQALPGVEVLNLGVCGYMTRQKVALAERLMPELEPDLVLVQIYNEGRRFVLEGTLDAAYDRWPELYAENFVGGERMTSASALVRFGLLGANRVALDAAVWDRTELAVSRDAAAMARLVDETDVPVLVVFPPAGGPDTALRQVDVPILDLAAVDNPFGPEGNEIHPPAPVYVWYAEVLASELEEAGHLRP
ncbi:MAG: hypothetical protein GY913_12695 [Proteobacteria bacterium]|nr:hypothetical protein [Pseudomonadota bacterium]MCP4917764.1 hypothetical protein [Pseudomonadota bacterium]